MDESKKNKFIDNLQSLGDDSEINDTLLDDLDNELDEFEEEEKIYNVSVDIHSKIMKYVEDNNLPLCEYLFENHIKYFLKNYV